MDRWIRQRDRWEVNGRLEKVGRLEGVNGRLEKAGRPVAGEWTAGYGRETGGGVNGSLDKAERPVGGEWTAG